MASIPPSNISRKTLGFISDYFFRSNERLLAWLMLMGAIFSIVGLTVLMSFLSAWFPIFWAALAAMDAAVFIASMQTFAILSSGMVALQTLQSFLVESLGIRWRNWFTQRLLEKYLLKGEENNYLDLMRFPNKLDNPQHRIQKNVRTFVDSTLFLSLGLVTSALRLTLFISTLWIVGGSLSFGLFGALISIPGYMVWTAIAFAATASLITQVIGYSLSKINRDLEMSEADFRQVLELLNQQSESIGQEGGEDYYRQSLCKKLGEITRHSNRLRMVRTCLTAFQNFYIQISVIFPYVAAAPLYFAGQIGLGQLMQLGFAFSQVTKALNWFITSFDQLANYKTSITRLVELENALAEDSELCAPKEIHTIAKEHSEELEISLESITPPDSTQSILKGLHLNFKPGENTLIQGKSGLGKSTLFKAIAGSWKYGSGTISRPGQKTLLFLAQKPSLPKDTLKAVLAYPSTDVGAYADEDYRAVLEQIGMGNLADELDTMADWSRRLSGGEQQRISFARALLTKPDWLFLDETTASLDPESETLMYQLIKSMLPKTTFVSIAHRPSVAQFHNRVIRFTGKNDAGVIEFSNAFQAAPRPHASNDVHLLNPEESEAATMRFRMS